jgi:hypothetical protein
MTASQHNLLGLRVGTGLVALSMVLFSTDSIEDRMGGLLLGSVLAQPYSFYHLFLFICIYQSF